MHSAFAPAQDTTIPIHFVTADTWPQERTRLDPAGRTFAESCGFEPKPGRHLVLPSASGGVAGVLFAIEKNDAKHRELFLTGNLPALLPEGVYRFANAPHDSRLAALAFALGRYRFARYKKNEMPRARLAPPGGIDVADLSRIVDGVTLARDLINTPANDMGPAELEDAARALGARHGATVNAIVGDDLLAQNFPLVHAVGRASARAPRLIDLRWGNAAHPRVTLVGKGVCFDTGGLDLKPSSGMLLMKKDMGGAAIMLALAHMIMEAGLKVALRLLIPAVENSVSDTAFRPLDVYPSRKGLTVEVGNTDAEGRLVLADALALADEDAPDLLIDAGTLTGAARVALGPDLPPYYTDDETLAREIEDHAARERDPVWRMPLWSAYDSMLDSKIADLNNVSPGAFAGSVTCALFLRRFVSAARTWAHFDVYGWNPSSKPARPEGGECQAARGLYALLKARYG
jgi:leucyl aminopeptidase